MDQGRRRFLEVNPADLSTVINLNPIEFSGLLHQNSGKGRKEQQAHTSGMMPMIRYLALAALLLLSPAVVAQNHLANSGFDTDLAGWGLSGAVLPDWTDFDVADDPNSGSALIKNVEAGAFSDVEVLRQCIVEGYGGYEWSAWFYIPSGQAQTGSVVIRYGYHANNTTCSGGFNATGGRLVNSPFDQWVHLEGIPFNAVINNTGSVQFIIAIRKTESGGEFKAYVDDARLFREFLLKSSFE